MISKSLRILLATFIFFTDTAALGKCDPFESLDVEVRNSIEDIVANSMNPYLDVFEVDLLADESNFFKNAVAFSIPWMELAQANNLELGLNHWVTFFKAIQEEPNPEEEDLNPLAETDIVIECVKKVEGNSAKFYLVEIFRYPRYPYARLSLNALQSKFIKINEEIRLRSYKELFGFMLDLYKVGFHVDCLSLQDIFVMTVEENGELILAINESETVSEIVIIIAPQFAETCYIDKLSQSPTIDKQTFSLNDVIDKCLELIALLECRSPGQTPQRNADSAWIKCIYEEDTPVSVDFSESFIETLAAIANVPVEDLQDEEAFQVI